MFIRNVINDGKLVRFKCSYSYRARKLKTFSKDFSRIEIVKNVFACEKNVVTLPKFELEFYLTIAEFTARWKSAFGI